MHDHLLLAKDIEIEWPGWSLIDNPFGEEFDEKARKRMVVGGKRIIPFLQKYSQKLAGNVLEIGPFFNPMMDSSEMKTFRSAHTNTYYIENDDFVIKWLQDHTNSHIINLDINDLNFPVKFRKELGNGSGGSEKRFDAVIVSQILNYVHFRDLFHVLKATLAPDGYIFINNVTDYGLPQLFSSQRPKSNEEIIKVSIEMGFSVVEQNELPKFFDKESYPRLILIIKS